MSLLDLWTGGAAAGCCFFIGLRGVMLRPEYVNWATAMPLTRHAIMACAAVFGGAAISIFRTDHTSVREAVVYSVVAIGTMALVINMVKLNRGNP